MTMKPGKGAHLVLNEKAMEFVQGALQEAHSVYSDELHDTEPKQVVDLLANDYGWTREKDNFGIKVYRSMPYKDGELRVSVVLTKKNELKLDVREWGTW